MRPTTVRIDLVERGVSMARRSNSGKSSQGPPGRSQPSEGIGWDSEGTEQPTVGSATAMVSVVEELDVDEEPMVADASDYQEEIDALREMQARQFEEALAAVRRDAEALLKAQSKRHKSRQAVAVRQLEKELAQQQQHVAAREQQFYEAEARLKDLARQERLDREQVQQELEQERQSLANTEAVREGLQAQLSTLEAELGQARLESERLQSQDPSWGVRDFEAVVDTAAQHGLGLRERVDMPANNFTLVFGRK